MPLLLGLLALASTGACSSCGDLPASPVTFRVVNRLDWPIFVRDTADELGLQVQRYEDGNWRELSEFAACACDACSEICSPCSCPAKVAMVRRIGAAGGAAERMWNGEFREEDTANCWGSQRQCVGDRRAAQPGRYRVKLCWASSLPAASSDRDRFPADLSGELNCATHEFELPAEGPVIVETAPPPACRSTADCKIDQLCLQGRCSSSCLPHEVPALDDTWNVEVGAPDNDGLFEASQLPSGAKVFRGTGKVSTVSYTAGTTKLTLVRTANGIEYLGSLYYRLPGTRAVPLQVGDELDVVVVDASTDSRRLVRAIAIRRGGVLLLAADTGRGGPVLPAAELSPFEVRFSEEPFACNPADCGRRFHRRIEFAAGEVTALLEPGKSSELKVGAETYDVVAVANYAEEVEGCGISPMTPYVVMWQPPAP